MFTKCANGSCSQLFHYSSGAMAFRVDRRSALAMYFGLADSTLHFAAGEIRDGVSNSEYHWLCPECLHIILVPWLDFGQTSGEFARTVHLISLDSALDEMRGEPGPAIDLAAEIPGVIPVESPSRWKTAGADA